MRLREMWSMFEKNFKDKFKKRSEIRFVLPEKKNIHYFFLIAELGHHLQKGYNVFKLTRY